MLAILFLFRTYARVMCISGAMLFGAAIAPAPAHHIAQGDFDEDGDVDDFLVFVRNFERPKSQRTRVPHQVIVQKDTVTITRTIGREIPPQDITIRWGSAWGNTDQATLHSVFTSVQGVLSEPLLYAYDSAVHISHDVSGPIVLYERNARGDYQVLIDSEGTYWGQQIFQFAHEYGHILSNYRWREGNDRQLWFEESIAAMASLYALRAISEKWKTDAPSQSMHFYALNGSLDSYWGNLRDNTPHINLSDVEFRQWYQDNRRELESDGYLRNKNRVVAWHLLDIFERNPEAWNAVRYMNKGPLYKNDTLQSYLSDWHQRTPPLWQNIPREILNRFGLTLRPKPAQASKRPRPVASPKGQEK